MKKIILVIALFFVLISAVNAVESNSEKISVTLLNQEPSPARAGDTRGSRRPERTPAGADCRAG